MSNNSKTYINVSNGRACFVINKFEEIIKKKKTQPKKMVILILSFVQLFILQ